MYHIDHICHLYHIYLIYVSYISYMSYISYISSYISYLSYISYIFRTAGKVCFLQIPQKRCSLDQFSWTGDVQKLLCWCIFQQSAFGRQPPPIEQVHKVYRPFIERPARLPQPKTHSAKKTLHEISTTLERLMDPYHKGK